MNQTLPLMIGKLELDLILANPRLDAPLRNRYSEFIRSNAPGFPVAIDWQESTLAMDQHSVDIHFSPDQVWMRAEGYDGNIQVSRGAKLNFIASDPVAGVDYFLRVLAAELAFLHGGLLFHGAGIFHRGKGYIFFGHSGSGKTTVSGLSIHDLVLNDDLVVITPGEIGWMAHATPFWNPTQVKPTNRSMPIQGMFRLIKDTSAFLKPMSAAQSVGELLASTPVLTSDPERLPLILQRCGQLSSAIPCSWLHFPKDDSFWNVIDKV